MTDGERSDVEGVDDEPVDGDGSSGDRASEDGASEDGASGEGASDGRTSDDGGGALDDVDVRDLLRGALRPPPGSVAPELLGGVQRKLRERSRGKFYGDGWSTAHAPRSTYLVTSAIMLVLILVIAVLLIPWEAVGL